MSESSSENETPETGLVSDEQLPEDLQPEKNPLARDPDDPDHPGQDDGSSDGTGPKVEGMPDMGEPGAGA